jgi:hypothetical protein
MVEIKILPQMTYKVLAAVFNRLIEVVGPYPFRRALLRGPLAHSSFDLNSIRYTIVKSKT